MDLTSIIEAVIALFAAVLTVFVVPWIKRKTEAHDMESLQTWIDIAVAAAQQMYHSLSGESRKDYVLAFLKEKGFDVDSAEIEAAIEAAVLKLHQQLNT